MSNSYSCPVCKSTSSRILHNELFDDRYGFPGLFCVMICESCQHAWLRNPLPENELVHLYSSFYPRKNLRASDVIAKPKLGDLKSWWVGDRRSIDWVGDGAIVLEVGCGSGANLLAMRNRGCQVTGLELDLNVLEPLKSHGLEVVHGSLEVLNTNAKFDYVVLDQVIEHFLDPVEGLRKMRERLVPDGRIVMTTPNLNGLFRILFGRSWIHWHVPYHMNWFSRSSMRAAGKKSGLEVEFITTITASEWMLYQSEHSLLPIKHGVPSSFWSGRSCSPRLLRCLMGVLRRLQLHHFISRLLDLFGVGDNLIVVLRRAP